MMEQPNAGALTNNFEFQALQEANNYRQSLIQEFAQHLRGSVLEIGAGVGQITALLQKLPEIKKVVSVEPDAQFCEAFRAALPRNELIQGTIAAIPPNSSWNAIVSINVLEHIRDDELELQRYRTLLAQARGALCLFVPARQEIYAPLDRDFGHFRRYSRRDLAEKLQRAGFRIVRLDYFNSLGYLAWWVSFCLLKQRHFNRAAVRFYDRIIFPVVRGFEARVCRPPFGQSLIAVADAR